MFYLFSSAFIDFIKDNVLDISLITTAAVCVVLFVIIGIVSAKMSKKKNNDSYDNLKSSKKTKPSKKIKHDFGNAALTQSDNNTMSEQIKEDAENEQTKNEQPAHQISSIASLATTSQTANTYQTIASDSTYTAFDTDRQANQSGQQPESDNSQLVKAQTPKQKSPPSKKAIAARHKTATKLEISKENKTARNEGVIIDETAKNEVPLHETVTSEGATQKEIASKLNQEVAATTSSEKVSAQKAPVKSNTMKTKTSAKIETKTNTAIKTKNKNTNAAIEETPKTSVYRVVRDEENREWMIKKDGAKRVIRRVKTKEEAIKIAKELSDNNNANLVIHKMDGKFQKQ